MTRWKWPKKAFTLGAGALLALGTARAADPNSPPPPPGAPAPAAAVQPSMAELLKRMEQLEKSNQELKQKLETVNKAQPAEASEAPAPSASDDSVRRIVGDYLRQQEDAKKAAEAQAKQDGVKVYSNLNLRGYVDNNGYPWLATPNNDFTMHVGSWVQLDNLFWTQTNNLIFAPVNNRVPNGAAFTPASTAAVRAATGAYSAGQAGGIGDLQNGIDFRRVRPFVEGTVWENFEYRFNLALENINAGATGLDEFWMAVNNVPVIGTIRVGHVKSTVGFEADMTASSRTMTFMERSAYSEAIENNINFVTGLWFQNAFLDQHVSYSATVAYTDPASATGFFFGDGQWFTSGRLTALPIYEENGRHWLHLGASGSWRNGTNNTTGLTNTAFVGGIQTPNRLFQIQARPQFRDSDPANGTGPGLGAPANSNNNRMIDTGIVYAQSDATLGTEICYVRGPLSFQAEYGWNFLNGVYGLPASNAVAAGITPLAGTARSPSQNYIFSGGYVQVAYTLTGEARGYDRARGTLSRPYFVGGPFSQAFVNWNRNGGFCHSLGAIELASRFDYTNLNDGTFPSRIGGGTMTGVTLGLNWYLNSNMVVMFDYVHDTRYNTVNNEGSVDGFGTRFQFSF